MTRQFALVCCGLLTACVGTIETPPDCPRANTLPLVPDDVSAALAGMEVLSQHADGMPAFVRGDLGRAPLPVALANVTTDLAEPLARASHLLHLEAAALTPTRIERDELGSTHVWFSQHKQGLDVVGGQLVLHLNRLGDVYALNGSARDGYAVSATPTSSASAAEETVRAQFDARLSFHPASLVFLWAASDSSLHLAWRVEAADETDFVTDSAFVDAHSGRFIENHTRVQAAMSRKTYNALTQKRTPGTLQRSEGDPPVADADVNKAHDNAGLVYQCYHDLFGRDSVDGQGLQLISTVHYDRNYNNAFWNGRQMTYGDGDGRTLYNLAGAFDVVAHELTHGVTQYTAGLVYQDEPGALNEGSSDIMAAVCDSFRRNGAVDQATWLLGEDAYTPATAGDALRYMDDPTKDGRSKDYYPARYQGTSDNGGVHTNSGIANLAFKLAVTGGQHPRGRTANVVPGVGMDRAARVFYRALTQYFTDSSQFADARAATQQAAVDLYGAAESAAITEAWAAVGVGPALDGGAFYDGGLRPLPDAGIDAGTRTFDAGSTALDGGAPPARDGGTPALPTDGGVQPLQQQVMVRNLNGSAGSERLFSFEVPASAARVSFQLFGGSGDADLFVRLGARPTLTEYDQRPHQGGNQEVVTLATPAPGTYFVMLRGQSAFARASLVAWYDFTGITTPTGCEETAP